MRQRREVERRRRRPRCARRRWRDSSGPTGHVGMRQVRHLEHAARRTPPRPPSTAASAAAMRSPTPRCAAIACSRSAGSLQVADRLRRRRALGAQRLDRVDRLAPAAIGREHARRPPRPRRRPSRAPPSPARARRGSAGCRARALAPPPRTRRARARRAGGSASKRMPTTSKRASRSCQPRAREEVPRDARDLRLLARVDRLERRPERGRRAGSAPRRRRASARRGRPDRSRRRGSGSCAPRSCSRCARRNASATASPRRPSSPARPRRARLLARSGPLARRARRRVARARGPALATVAVAITRDEVRRVAALARLRLEPDEEERLTADLDHILDAFARLAGARHDAASSRPRTSRTSARRCATTRSPTRAGDEALLANAPARDGRLLPRAEDHRVDRESRRERPARALGVREAAARVRRRELSVGRADARRARAHRRGRAARRRVPHRRARPRRSPPPRPIDRRVARRRRPGPARRRPGRRQGHHLHRGRPDDRRLAHPRATSSRPTTPPSSRACARAGAVIVGKLNCDEFAMGSSTENSAFGVDAQSVGPRRACPAARRAARPRRSPRGECLGALGTDTGGSIRQPAAFCGVVGLKPTYGRVSRYGVIAYASSLDQVGPLARDVARRGAACSRRSPATTRATRPSSPRPVPRYADALDERRARACASGCRASTSSRACSPRSTPRCAPRSRRSSGSAPTVEPVSLPHTEYAIADLLPDRHRRGVARTSRATTASATACARPARAGLRDMYEQHARAQGFGAEVKRRIMLGTYALSAGYYDAYYLKAQKVRTLIRRDFEQAFARCDALVTPVAPTTAFRLGEKTDDPLHDVPLRHLHDLGEPGRPARRSSLPCGFDARRAADRPADDRPAVRRGDRAARRRRLRAGDRLAPAAARRHERDAPTDSRPSSASRCTPSCSRASKIFCGCSAAFGAPPNTHTSARSASACRACCRC